MKRWTVISSVVSTLFVASILTFSLSTEIASAHGPACKGHHKDDCNGGGGGGGTVRVDVTFRDSPGDGLQSDGKGTYKHKVEKVSAGIGGLGEFALMLTKGNQLAIRTLFLDFRTCVSEDTGTGDCTPPFQPPIGMFASSSGESVGLLTIHTSGVDLLAMGIGETRTDLRLALNLDLNLVNAGGVWVLVFDDDGFGNFCPEGNGINTDIDVTRMPADKWVIEATSAVVKKGIVVSGDVACLKKRDQGAMGDIFSGLYSMPFKMTVVKH